MKVQLVESLLGNVVLFHIVLNCQDKNPMILAFVGSIPIPLAQNSPFTRKALEVLPSLSDCKSGADSETPLNTL